MQLHDITTQTHQAVCELLKQADPKPGGLFVVGCSTSSLFGNWLGTDSHTEAAQAVLDGIAPPLKERGLFLAAQCCEHLNRALVVEEEAARRFRLEPVCVLPQPKAGGAFATACWNAFEHPVAVEHIQACCGMDIGGTMIGMHLRPVAVPVRLSLDHIAKALLLCARTRPKLIGGDRAVYPK